MQVALMSKSWVPAMSPRGRLRALGILALVCCTLQAAIGVAGKRELRLLRGTVRTRRKLAEYSGRFLKADTTQLFILGVPSDYQEAVEKDFLNGACTPSAILSPLGTDHWLVSASASCIDSVLATHEETTAAPYPAPYKLSPALDKVLHASKTFGISQGVAPVTTKADVLTSGLPQTLSHVRTSTNAAGTVQVVLTATGLPLGGATDAAKQQAATREAQQLQQGLTGALGYSSSSTQAAAVACAPRVYPIGLTGVYEVHVCLKDAHSAATWLSNQHSIQWVGISNRKKLHNIYAASELQGGGISGPTANILTNSSLRPMWQAGLDGSGQLIGIADTGVDMGSCYFWDPAFQDYSNNSANIYTDPDTGINYFHNSSARKVTYYFAAADWEDTDGHGSHTSGTLAGAAYGTDPVGNPDYATGIAPNAKIAFYDFYRTPRNSSDDGYLEDADPGDIYEVLYKNGVRVMSNSWGYEGDYGYDTLICNLLDSYLWTRPDFLILFAAGNDGGNQTLHLNGTVYAPATCKNIVAVGATDNWVSPASYVDMYDSNGTQVTIPTSAFTTPTMPDIRITARDSNGVIKSQFNVSGSNLYPWTGPPTSFSSLAGQSFTLVVANPLDACSPLTGSPNYTGKAVLAQRGSCYFYEKAINIDNTHAAVGIVFDNTVNGAPFYADGTQAANVSSAFVSTNSTLGRRLTVLVSQNLTVTMTVFNVDPDPYNTVAGFSSYGASYSSSPKVAVTQDVRIKPEIMAPGYLRSVLASASYQGKVDQCATVTMAGTSMATPAAASSATIIRQYFTDGYYPTGQRVSDNSYEPSASLVRAALAAGAVAMTGTVEATGAQLTAPPNSPYQGYGRVSLGRSLPLANSSLGWNMTVVDRAVFYNSRRGSDHNYQINVTGNGPLIVVLTWFDWPGFPGIVPVLVNDLDLNVTNGNTTWHGNNVRTGDGSNTIEKVYIPQPAPGGYTITVRPWYLFIAARPQNYSLVVLGGISGQIQDPANPAWARSQSSSSSPSSNSSNSDSSSPSSSSNSTSTNSTSSPSSSPSSSSPSSGPSSTTQDTTPTSTTQPPPPKKKAPPPPKPRRPPPPRSTRKPPPRRAGHR